MTHSSSTTSIKPVTFDGDVFYIDESLIDFGPSVVSLWKKLLVLVIVMPVLCVYTILVLLFGKAVSSFVVSKFLPNIMKVSNKRTRAVRHELLKSIRGQVLDLGAGGGMYIKYLNPETVDRYVALEPNVHLHESIRWQWEECFPNKKEHTTPTPKLDIYNDFLEEFVSSGRGKPGSFDYVILGNVMCEIDDPKSVLQLVDKLLKPATGRVYFCEHVLADENKRPWLHKIQNLINPWWCRVSDGCHCNRDTIGLMKKSCPHWEIVHWTFSPIGFMPWNCIFEMGLAASRREKQN